MKKRHISKLIISVCVMLVLVLSVASCDIFTNKISDINGVKPHDLYRTSVRSYREAKESNAKFSANIVLEYPDESGKTIAFDIVYSESDYSATIDGKENATFLNGKMYYTDKNGGKHAYDSTRNDVINFVENSTSIKLVQPAMFKDYPDSWFDGMKLKVAEDGKYTLTIEIDEKKSLDNRDYSKFYTAGSSVTLCFTTDGTLESMILENVTTDNVKCNMTLNFNWSEDIKVSLSDSASSYQNKGFYSYSSGNVPGEFHDHIFGEWGQNTATCTAPGVETRSCTVSGCTETETRNTEAIGHNAVQHEGKAATCTESGYKAYETCTRCDYTTYTEIAVAGHSMGKWTTEVAATCESGGTETSKCTLCGEASTRNTAPLGHDIVKHAKKNATCTESGYKAYETCARCSDYNTFEEVDALGHDFTDCKAKDATCTSAGHTAYKVCERCETVEGYEAIDALGHNITRYEQKNPTCTEDGYKAYDSCSRCGYTTFSPLAKLGHNILTMDAKAPTCTDSGWESYIACSREDCGFIEGFTVVDALGHDISVHEPQAPTCTDIGWGWYATCSRCDYSTYSELDALGHDMSEWMDNTATCTEAGTETKYCSRCSHTETQDSESLGHDVIYHDAQDKTCTAHGWYAYETCSRCSDYNTYVEIPASHEMGDWYVSIEGNCTTGEERSDCAECDYYETRTPEHDIVYHDAKAPTCTETGHNAYETCTKCDYTTYEELPIQHQYENILHTDANCTDPECDVNKCAICGHTTVTYGTANGHSYENGVCTTCGRDKNDLSLPSQKFDD